MLNQGRVAHLGGVAGPVTYDLSRYTVMPGGIDTHAIVSATSRAAESLGLSSTIRAIEPGLEADLIALDGDPATDINALRRLVFVMKCGRVAKQP